MRKPSSGNKIADPAGTRTKVWSQRGEHSGCPGLATLGPLPRPLECEGRRKETTGTLWLRGKFLLEVREREQPEASAVAASRTGGRERKGGESRQAVPGAVEQRQQQWRESLPVMLRQEGAG